MNGVKKSQSWKGKSYVIFFKCEMIICVELCVWSGPELRCLLSWYQLYWFTGSVQQEQECGPCTKIHTQELPQAKGKPFCRSDITKRNKSVLDVCLSLNERPEMPWAEVHQESGFPGTDQAKSHNKKNIQREGSEFMWRDLVTFEWLENCFENKLFACYLNYLSLICMTSHLYEETKMFIRQINYNFIKRVLNVV